MQIYYYSAINWHLYGCSNARVVNPYLRARECECQVYGHVSLAGSILRQRNIATGKRRLTLFCSISNITLCPSLCTNAMLENDLAKILNSFIIKFGFQQTFP